LNGGELDSLINRPSEEKRTVNVSERAADTSTGSICWISLCRVSGERLIPWRAGCAHPFSVVQSDVADSDDVQQRGFAIIQPGYRAWLVAVTDSPAGRVENLETGELAQLP